MDKLSFSLKKSVKFLLVLSLLGSAFSIYAKPDLLDWFMEVGEPPRPEIKNLIVKLKHYVHQ